MITFNSQEEFENAVMAVSAKKPWPFPEGSKPGNHRTIDSYEQEIGLLKAEIEELRNASKGVKFTVNGVEKEFMFDYGQHSLIVYEEDGGCILSINHNGTYSRPCAVYGKGYQLNKHGQIKQQKDSP